MSKRIVLRSRSLVVFCGAVAVGSVVGFGALAISGPGPDPKTSDYVGTAAFGLVFAVLFARATRMRVELNDSGVTVYRVLTTDRVPWTHLADVSVDYGGLRLTCTDGNVVTAGSLGKSNLATWLGRRVAADHRVELIKDEMSRRRPPAEALPTNESSCAGRLYPPWFIADVPSPTYSAHDTSGLKSANGPFGLSRHAHTCARSPPPMINIYTAVFKRLPREASGMMGTAPGRAAGGAG